MLHASGGRQKALCRVSVLSATIYHIKVVSEHKLSSMFIHLMQAIRWGREGNERGGEAAKATARWAWRLPYCLHRAPERAGLFYVVFPLVILVDAAIPELLDEAGKGPCGVVAACTMPSPQSLRFPLAALPAEYESTNPSLLLYYMNHFILLLKYFAFLFFTFHMQKPF